MVIAADQFIIRPTTRVADAAMAHAAADCASADGRPVLAVATTAKAVAELRSAGLSARTIAQFRIDLTSGTLPRGTVADRRLKGRADTLTAAGRRQRGMPNPHAGHTLRLVAGPD